LPPRAGPASSNEGEDWSGNPGRACNELEEWNDQAGRTDADVMAVLSAAENVTGDKEQV
jgi:hypothetical protein